MSQWEKIVIRWMRYVTFLLIVGFVVFLLIHTSGSSRPFEEVAQSVEATLDNGNLTRQSDAALKRDLGLNAADYDGVIYYCSEFSISAEKVLLVKVKNDAQTTEVIEAIQRWTEARMNDFEGYAPEAVQILEDAKQSVRGKYIFFAAAPKAEQYLEVFNDSL